MKIILFIPMLLISFNAYADNYFAELRVGPTDTYHKVVNTANAKLEGDFKGVNLGLRAGRSFGQHSLYLEYNPEQDVEIKSANELAKVESTFIGYRYLIGNSNFFAGGQVGQSSFTLEQGPGGVMFIDNPTTKGITYGVNTGYIQKYENIYLSADAAYNFGSYKKDGPASTPVKNIEIQHQFQLNLSIGTTF